MADAVDEAADALLAASRGHTAAVSQRVAGGAQTLAVNVPGADGGGGDVGSIVPPAAAASGAFDGVLIDGFRVPEVWAPGDFGLQLPHTIDEPWQMCIFVSSGCGGHDAAGSAVIQCVRVE